MSEEKKTERVAMQHHQLSSNNLFTIGRAGKKRIVEAQWEGTYTDENNVNTKYSIEAEGTRTMDATDQDLFLMILYLHRISANRELVKTEKHELKATEGAKEGYHYNINISGYQLIKMLGWKNEGYSYRKLTTILNRLGRVYLLCKTETPTRFEQWGTHLLYYKYTDDSETNSRKLQITLSPMIAKAAHRQGADLHSSHCLFERQGLSKNCKVLHGALCSKLRMGKSQRFKTETLIGYLHGTSEVDRRRKSEAKKIIHELKDTLLGWNLHYQEDSDNWRISRPKFELCSYEHVVKNSDN